MTRIPPVHPGVVLLEEFLDPMGISQTRLAMDIRVPVTRINDIVRGKRAITADTAKRLGQYFGFEAEFWMNLQQKYDLDVEEDKNGEKIRSEVRVLKSA